MAAPDLSVIPETETVTTTSGGGGAIESKADAQAIADEQKAAQAEAEAQKAEGQAQADTTEAKAASMDPEIALRRQEAADAAANHQDFLDRQQAAIDAAKSAEDQYATHKFEDYWSHHGVAKRIQAAVAGFAGGAPAVDAIQRTMDRDFETQKANATKDLNLARLKGENIDAIARQEAAVNGSLAIKQAKAHEAVAAEALQRQLNDGVPLEIAKNNVVVAQNLAKAATLKREALQHYDKHYQSSTSRKVGTPAGQAIAAARLGLQEQKELEAQVQRFASENKLPELQKQRETLASLQDKLKPYDEKGKPRKIDPETQIMALMELDKAAKGGTANAASMQAALGHLGGTGEKFGGLLEKAQTGGLGPGQLNILRKAIDTAHGANKSEAANLQKQFTNGFYKDPNRKHQNTAIQALEAQYFGPWGYAQRPEAPAASAPGAAPAPPAANKPRGVTIPGLGHGYITSDGTFHPDGT